MGNCTENCQAISIVIRYDSFNNHKLIGTDKQIVSVVYVVT